VRRAADVLPLAVVAVAMFGCGAEGPALLRIDMTFADEGSVERSALEFSDPNAWRWTDAVEGGALELAGPSNYTPPHRSPLSFALLPDVVDDFVLEVECEQTGRDYGHRDLCLFFGYVDPAHLHYVHLAPAPDEHAHNVFRVDGAPRAALFPVQDSGIVWGDGAWHTLRLERRGATITVGFDGVVALKGASDTFRAGRVGVGSFDDTGRFRRITLRELD
jgi:hypothetical protein